MMEVVDKVQTLRLDLLNQDWVQGIYYSEFLEFGEFPCEYEEILDSLEINRVFKEIMRAINNWLRSEREEEKSWSELSKHIPHQKLLAILAYYINHGSKNVVNKDDRTNALLASRVYYRFMSISGYKAYQIYHSQVFAQSLVCLGYPKMMCDQEATYYNSKELTKEVNSVIKELGHFVLDLRSITDSLQLNPRDMNFEDILGNLVDITGGAIVNKLNVDKIELTKISQVIYEIIDMLICNAEKEPDPDAIKMLFKCILPKLIAASEDSRSANNLVRASYVTYSGCLLTKYGKAALSGYMIMLEHLCYAQEGIERAEVRQTRTSLVVGLMSLLPHKSYRRIVEWILLLSDTAKVQHRHIALEILAKLLCNEPEENEKPLPQPAAEKQTEATNTEGGEQATGEKQGEGETSGENAEATPTNSDQPQPETYQITTDDDASQDSQEVSEDEVAGLLRQRAHTAPHTRILRAVYERVADVSSVLRARAIHILTDCLDTHQEPLKLALQEFQGSGLVPRAVAVSARGVCDERASVRRAAAALLHRGLAHTHHAAPHHADLQILVGLCHDASIIVRSAAISALGDLVTTRTSEVVLDAFLNGIMHQLSDPETKVQDLVISLVQNVLIDRLQKYLPGNCQDQLPWMFLAGVTRHKMTPHLKKACTLLAKGTKCISPKLVDIVSSHLGAVDTERDVHALLLLNSVAEHVDYNNIHFALEYYYKLAEGAQQPCDSRLMCLILELLSTWSRWARLAERSKLRDHLVQRLTTAQDDGCRIPCATLAAQLDPHSLTWATELLQLAERRAACSSSVWEWLRAADLSLVAPEPPAPGLFKLFLDAVNNPPLSWGGAEQGAAVAGLGRLCVRARGPAAAAAPALAALLARTHAPIQPRLNAVRALTDICIRYTCIVEPLLDSVCACLSADAAPELRRVAARSVTRLLLGGYLRLRTPLYFRYCALCADEDADVRAPAEHYLTGGMPSDTIFNYLVECVLHFNKENEDYHLSYDARHLIYDVMLQRMTSVQKFNLQCRLAKDVLKHAASFIDEDEEIPAGIISAVMDTIVLFCGPRLKLSGGGREGDAADLDELQDRVTTNILTHKMKRAIAEVVVPAIVKLYSHLRTTGGQVSTYLVRFATDLLEDYRTEIEELIDNDEELVERIRHFQETIGIEPSFGNTRNLVTQSTSHEPETPKASRRRATRHARSPPRKRALRI